MLSPGTGKDACVCPSLVCSPGNLEFFQKIQPADGEGWRTESVGKLLPFHQEGKLGS